MRRLTTIIVLTSLGIAGCTGSGGDAGSQGRVLADQGILDANEYRREIETLEAILYKEGPSEFSDYGRVTAAMTRLYGMAMQREKHPLKLDAAQRVMFLSARADMSDVGYSTPDLAAMRTDWEEVRLYVFGQEDWFRESTAALEQSQTRTVPAADPLDVSELNRVIERLGDLIDDGRYECDALGEPVYEPGYVSGEGEVQIADWNEFHRDWNDRINYIADRLPSQPSWNGNQDFAMAYQSVGQAMNELRLVPSGVGDWATPFRSSWESRFDEAERKLIEARGYLEKL